MSNTMTTTNEAAIVGHDENGDAITARDQAGMEWWNSLEPVARCYWLRKAQRVLGRDPSPSDAYSVYLDGVVATAPRQSEVKIG